MEVETEVAKVVKIIATACERDFPCPNLLDVAEILLGFDICRLVLTMLELSSVAVDPLWGIWASQGEDQMDSMIGAGARWRPVTNGRPRSEDEEFPCQQ
jgi:hypothetical protein